MSVDTNSILYQIGEAVKAAGQSGGSVDIGSIESIITATEDNIE